MVTRAKKAGEEGTAPDATSDLARTIRDSAQQIWLAGLGAFSKAQEEGGKVFQALVKEGMTIQRRTQDNAGGKLNEASSRMASMATELSSMASGQWDKLESLFEERVSRAMKKLGVPTSRDIDDLAARIDELDRTVAALRTGQAATRAAVHKTAARKPPVQRPMARAPRKRTPVRKTAGE